MGKARASIPAILAASFILTGCGAREPLRPPPGANAPPAPAMAARTPTTEEMLTPPPIARPERALEPLRRSEAREEDRFDLPPP